MKLTKSDFTAKAQPLPVTIAGQNLVAVPKEFSTGSVGFNINGKMPVTIGDQTVMVQVSCNLTAIGSKEWAQ